MVETRQDWKPRDFWLGLLFFVCGVLVAAFVAGAIHNGLPMFVWGTGVLLAPLLLLLGGNAMWKSLRARA